MYKPGRQIYLGRQDITDLRDLVEMRLMTLNDDISDASDSIEDYTARIDDPDFGDAKDKKRWTELREMFQKDLDLYQAEQKRLDKLVKKLWYYVTPEEAKGSE